MPKRKRQPEGPGEEAKKTTTKVSVGLLRKARMVSIHREIDLFDYIEGILTPVVERDYDEMIREEAREAKGRKPSDQ